MKKLLVPYKNFVIHRTSKSILNLMLLILGFFLKIVDRRVSYYCNNLGLLLPKLKFTFRNLKKGVQEFHRKFVLDLQIILRTAL